MSRATPVHSSVAFDYTPRTRSGPAAAFQRELSDAVSTRRSDASSRAAGSTPAAVPAPVGNAVSVARVQVDDAAGRAGNPFATSGSPALPPAAAPPAAAEPKGTAWCPWTGPCDPRDAIPVGGGQLTASGSPRIAPNAVPTRNQYNYAGPASKNPYFTNPGNPLREGYVAGFNNWFLGNPAILGPNQKSTAANPMYFATQDGAQEALRLVQQYEPGAQLTSRTWGGGPFLSNQPMYFITLPSGKELNAGGLLDGYYNHGSGVTISSDTELENTVRLA